MSEGIKAAVAAALRRDEAAFLRSGSAFAQDQDDPAAAWRRIALALNAAGQPVWAARAQQECIRLGRNQSGFRPDDEAFLGDLLLRGGRLNLARDVLQDLVRRQPDFIPALVLLGGTWATAAHFDEAAPIFRRILQTQPDHIQALDGLARAAGWLGRDEEALQAGRRSLTLKDKAVRGNPPAWQFAVPTPPAFDPRARKRNVIAYSLWGDAPRYIETAVRNAEIAPEIYPSWHCRFYCDDTVPLAVRNQLAALDATVIMKSRPPIRHGSLFWRFLVADDPTVDRFLVRDADSLLTVRERVAVDDWLLSEKPFHAMRDWWSHTELLLAGMWGGCGGMLTGLSAQVERYLKRPEVANRALDQGFLAHVVWPAIRGHCLIHDDLYGSLGARPFPPLGRLPKGEHVGMNAKGYDEVRNR
jgi:tetratricopeptide (TPR) repeat protein